MRPNLPDPATKLYWEDFTPGRVMEYGPRRITREEILEFAGEFDPQPFHIDEVKARETMLGGLCASGWHTCCIAMRMMADGFVLNSSSMGAPGVDEVLWLAPVRPGDDLTLRATVLSARASTSRPELGFASVQIELSNASGTRVISLTAPLMFGRRVPGAAA